MTDHHAVNTNWYRAAALFGVLVVTTLVVLPVFDNGFVYDDVDVIANGDCVSAATRRQCLVGELFSWPINALTAAIPCFKPPSDT